MQLHGSYTSFFQEHMPCAGSTQADDYNPLRLINLHLFILP